MTLKQIGKKIKALRIEAGLTQLEVSEKAGLRRATIADIEAGKLNFEHSTLEAIGKVLKFEIIVK